MIPEGAILVARQIISSKIFTDKPAMWLKIFMYFICTANHKDSGRFRRGECYTTYAVITTVTGATNSQIDHCIRWMKKCQMLATRKATRGFYVTITNYDTYQCLENYKSDTKSEREATQKRHRSDTINKNVLMKECNIKSHLLQVFNHWNNHKGKSVVKGGKKITWHSHKLKDNSDLSPTIVKAIKDNTPPYTAGDICAAIDNYAAVLLGDDYFWSYPWSLSTFLTVKYEKHKNADRKWWQFLPDNFILVNYEKNKTIAGEQPIVVGPDGLTPRKRQIAKQEKGKGTL